MGPYAHSDIGIGKSDILSGHIWVDVKRYISAGYNLYLCDVWLRHGDTSGVQCNMFWYIQKTFMYNIMIYTILNRKMYCNGIEEVV